MWPILSNLYRRQDRTPDFHELRMHDYVALFVYDTMKKGFLQDDYLKNSHYLGKGYTITDKYYMNVTAGNGNAVIFKEDNPHSMKSGKIRGEVYAVKPELLLDIDSYHQNGIMYDREQRNIVLQDQRLETGGKSFIPTRRCHLYIGRWEHWKIYNTRSGMLIRGPKPIKDYYDFVNPHRWTPEDYKDYML